jgi:ABC-type Fe3+/spermidine/putrescine transport system ATPase subunit
VDVSLRPEAISIRELDPEVGAAAVGSGGPWSLSAVVEQAAYLGASVQYQVRTDGGSAMTILAPKMGARLPVGSPVALSWPPDEALVLGDRPAAVEEMS